MVYLSKIVGFDSCVCFLDGILCHWRNFGAKLFQKLIIQVTKVGSHKQVLLGRELSNEDTPVSWGPFPECALLKRFNRFIGLEVHCWNASFIEINQQELLVWQLKICCIFQHRSVEIFNRISWFSRQKHQFLHVSKTKKNKDSWTFFFHMCKHT